MIYKIWVDKFYDIKKHCYGTIEYYEEYDFIDAADFMYDHIRYNGFYLYNVFDQQDITCLVLDSSITFERSFVSLNYYKGEIFARIREEKLNKLEI